MVHFDLSGKTVLITGASSGLGQHFARLLGSAGAQVVATARRIEPLQSLSREICAQGGQCAFRSLDVTDEQEVAECFDAHGNIDILVNCAGIVSDGPVIDQESANWDQVIDTNLRSLFLTSRAFARMAKAQNRGGAIVNIASILGLRQAGNVAAYAVSKAGVIQFTKVLALEFARLGIRVNALAPGYFETQLNRQFFESEAGKKLIGRIPSRRLGKPEELDGAFLLLCSDAASYITGSVLTVDGGHSVNSL
ncbi:SDR family NAD(P)-dependent oxidoreductase [Sphingobium sp. CR2-8]|uniref:SDR family NAD(P)-dependent oxidoreductase n=1 Tax=Sphingobium sp. CR2-8 TaxID=1306534 RepID=UPI002DB8C5A2|nr:SDR family NAD(P)-dependent oxidoreductase [Sphingobium sp. CR2-8]MEC3909388.1 SDR family NAD(P)-dependent oxidoreductase [Sphingobium sp. CR2-8]